MSTLPLCDRRRKVESCNRLSLVQALGESDKTVRAGKIELVRQIWPTWSKATENQRELIVSLAETVVDLGYDCRRAFRRVFRSSAAASSTAAVAAPSETAPIGGSVSPVDPVIAAIERYVAAERATGSVVGDFDSPEDHLLCDELLDARWALSKTVPTTLKGLRALARFLNHQSDVVVGNSLFFEGPEADAFFSSLDKAVTAIAAAYDGRRAWTRSINRTRRMRTSSAVASVASAAVAAPSIAAPIDNSAGLVDPVIVAIERCIAAERASDSVVGDFDSPEDDLLCDECLAARRALAETVPTTLAGLGALARFLNHQSNDVLAGNSFFEMDEAPAFFASLDQAVTAIAAAYGERYAATTVYDGRRA